MRRSSGRLAVHPWLMTEMTDSLKLERRMFHVEVIGKTVLKAVENPPCPAFSKSQVAYDHMGAQDGKLAAQRPGVQIVDGDDLGKLL